MLQKDSMNTATISKLWLSTDDDDGAKVTVPDPTKRKDLIGKVTFVDERFLPIPSKDSLLS